jgi:hypothetical protein
LPNAGRVIVQRPKRITIVLAVVACVMMAQAAWPGTYLAVSGGESERVLACLPLEAGTQFHLEFVNSIYLAPVRETFVHAPAEGMCLVKVESPSAGVFEYYGLEPDGSGIARLHRPVGEIRLRSHDYENHRLSAGDKSIRLKGLVPDGEPLLVSVRTGVSCGP